MTALHPEPRVIPANEYRRERWRNQLGWTREICRHPEASESWDWRLSIAEIEHDSAFSVFPGIDRALVLLSGLGLRLRFDDGDVRELLAPYEFARFAGERSVVGELVQGPTHDFNLMWRRDQLSASLWRRPLVGSMVVFVEPADSWALHLLSGHLQFDSQAGLPAMHSGDTAILTAGGVRRRYGFDGGGELLLVRLSPVWAGDGADADADDEAPPADWTPGSSTHPA